MYVCIWTKCSHLADCTPSSCSFLKDLSPWVLNSPKTGVVPISGRPEMTASIDPPKWPRCPVILNCLPWPSTCQTVHPIISRSATKRGSSRCPRLNRRCMRPLNTFLVAQWKEYQSSRVHSLPISDAPKCARKGELSPRNASPALVMCLPKRVRNLAPWSSTNAASMADKVAFAIRAILHSSFGKRRGP